MSEVILDTITGKSTATTITIGSTPVVSASANSMTIRGEGTAQTSIQQGLAKAFISIDVSAAAAFSADDSFNIASVTDAATGVFTIAYTNAMKTSRYPAPAGCYTTGGDSINTRGENTTGTSLNMAAADGSASDIDSYVVITGTMA